MKLMELLKKVHRDETGTVDVQTLLVIGAIVLPIVGVLIVFRDRIFSFVDKETQDTMGKEKNWK